MCQNISGCKWMFLNIGPIYILKYLGTLPKTRIYGSSESAKYCDQSKVDEVLVSYGRYYHHMIIKVWYELYYHGVNFFNLVKPLYPKSNRTWATGLQDLHWDFQSQVMQMKIYFQYCIIFRFLTSTIPSWFRRYGNQRCCFWRVFFCNTTQNLHCNFILPLARFTFQMPRRQSSSMLRFPIYFWASSPLVRFSICSGHNFQFSMQA